MQAIVVAAIVGAVIPGYRFAIFLITPLHNLSARARLAAAAMRESHGCLSTRVKLSGTAQA